jgi:hypothetical protein
MNAKSKTKPVRLSLTSRAKMGAARKPKKAKPAGLKAQLAALVEQVVETVETVAPVVGLDSDQGPAPENVGEIVGPQAQALVEETAGESGLSNIRGVTSEQALHYAQLLTGGWVTPKEVEELTGLNERARCKVDAALTKAGYRLVHKRNPERVAGDRDTANLYHLEGRA